MSAPPTALLSVLSKTARSMLGFDAPPGPNANARFFLLSAGPFLRWGCSRSSLERRISLAVQSQKHTESS